MAFSTTAKVVSGLAAASTAVVGSTLTYKYMAFDDLLQAEKDAISAENWTVSSVNAFSSGQIINLSMNISFSKIDNEQSVTPWTCILSTSETTSDSDNPAEDTEAIKKDLLEFFGATVNVSSESTIKIPESHKQNKKGLVTSCSRNRKKEKQANDLVVSEITLSLVKTDPSTGNKYKFNKEDLKKIFEGAWGESKQVEDSRITIPPLENQ